MSKKKKNKQQAPAHNTRPNKSSSKSKSSSKNRTEALKPPPKATQQKQKEQIRLPEAISSTPKSAILVADITSSDKHIGQMAIVTEANEQSGKNGVYWIGRSRSAAILVAIGTGGSTFSYKDCVYSIASFKLYGNAQKYIGIVSRFCNPDHPETVYIFSHKTIASLQSDNFESVTAMVPCANSSYPVPIQVIYDRVHHRYFLNDTTYSLIRQRYGLPYLRTVDVSNVGNNSGSLSFAHLKPESELKRLGYNVNAQNGAPLEERRQLLRNLMDTGIMGKPKIINHLEYLIKTRSSMTNMENAILEWRSDLKFVLRYDIDKQRKIWVDAFRSKYSGTKMVLPSQSR